MKANELLQALLTLKEDNPAIFDNLLIDVVSEEDDFSISELKLEKLFNKINILVY